MSGNKYEVGLDKPDGVRVVLTVNGHPIVMSYDTANKIAVMLRGYGKVAKKNAGDTIVKTIGFGHLTDAVQEEHKFQRRRDPTALFFKAG